MADLTEENRLRAFRRFELQFAVLVNPQADDNTPPALPRASKITAMVTNISMSGLCFHAALEFPVNSALQIEITIGSQTYSVPVIVRRGTSSHLPGRTVHICGVQYVKSEATSVFIPVLAKYLAVRGVLKKT